MSRQGMPHGVRVPSRLSLVMTAITLVTTLGPPEITYLPPGAAPAAAAPDRPKATGHAVTGPAFRLSPPPAAGAR